MNLQARIVLLVVSGVAAVLICVALARMFLAAPAPDAGLMNAATVQPELRVRIRDSEQWTGAPILVNVSLHNLEARRVARKSDPTRTAPDIPTILLNDDWRLGVSFTLTRQHASGQPMPLIMETPVKLLSFSEPELTLGVISLMGTWAVAPEKSERLGVGQYSLNVQLDTEGLIPDQCLPNTKTLSVSASFSLAPSSGQREAAQTECTSSDQVGHFGAVA